MSCWSLPALALLFTALAGSVLAASAPDQGTREARAAASVGIENGVISLRFDRTTGALVSLRNIACGDEYLKDPGREGNPFRLYVDATELPRPAVDPNWWSGRIEGAMGGRIVDAADCRLASAAFRRCGRVGALKLVYRHAETGLQVQLDVRLGDGEDMADCALTVRNLGASPHTVMTAFPHLAGLQLGPKRGTNLGLMLASYGTPGVPAWTDGGGFYGREVTMQLQAVYEPACDEGFGFIVMDPDLQPKLLRRFAPGGMSALYIPSIRLLPGQAHRFPVARLIAHRGCWRVLAQRYGEWFRRAFKLRRPPAWLKSIDLYSGAWMPSAGEVAEAAAHPESRGVTSFAQLPRLYLGDQYDLKEWAQYNDGVRANPATYGAYMADGVWEFRRDLGGAEAMREGVRRLHAVGRRVMFYVAGNSILKDSTVLKGTALKDWMLMDRPGRNFDVGYPNGMSVCPGYAPWQDHLAATAKRILAETGADGIRLDELGSFVPCFNPAHHHRTPFDSNNWLRELVRKVRAAMDEVNPHAILFTEGPIDYLHESCDGALQMFQPGRDIDAMRVAIPSYVGFAYHPGAVESALNGWVGGKTTARRVEWPWAHRGLIGRPADYGPGPGPELKWQELRASFPEAVVDGEVTPADPAAVNAPRWVGRLWQGRRYWLLVGGSLDASPPGEPVTVRLPELPTDVQHAFEFDAATLEMRDARLRREPTGIYLTMTGSFGAVLLPRPDCPPLLRIDGPIPDVTPGGEVEVSASLFGPWRTATDHASATISCDGLDVRPKRLSLPGHIRIHAPQTADPGFYPLRLNGNCLPLKRWIRVVARSSG
jgi:hypothetical protein